MPADIPPADETTDSSYEHAAPHAVHARLPEVYPNPAEEARPGLAPGARSPVGTLFAALYGELVPHPWRDAETARDAYGLFSSRSLAMRWLDDVGGVVRTTADGIEEWLTGAAGLWGMNDAGQEHPLAAAEPPLVAWFQVGVEPVSAERPLPVQRSSAAPGTRRSGSAP